MEKTQYSNKRYYLQFAGYFLIFGIIVAVITSFINYNLKYSDIAKELQVKADSEANFKKHYLSNYIDKIELMLSSIQANDLTNEYINNRSDENLKKLNDLFYSLIYSNKDLMQLRYINEEGMEIVRIDRAKDAPDLKIIRGNNLQNKSNRYYFKEASNILGGTFWHSRIDLNIEHGEIEIPFRPTFRVATPLIIGNKLQGILIANILMDNLLDVLTNSTSFHVYMIDSEGEVIINPDHKLSWSRYLENKPDIQDLLPEYAKAILVNKTYSDKKIFSYSYADLFKNKEGLKIIFLPKNEVVGEMIRSNTATAAIVALIVLLVSIPLSWVASIVPSRLQNNLAKAYDEISKYANVIDRNIPTSRTDKDGNIIEASSRFLEMTGYTKKEIIGKSHNLFRHPDTDVEHYSDMWKTISKGEVWSGEMKDIRKDGSTFWILQTITPEINSKGEISAYTSIAQDITQRKLVEQLSITDRLTKLYNRHKLDDALQHEVNRYNRYRTNFCAIILDIDHFKQVNDNYGHQAGDNVLVKLAQILKENTRQTDVCGRWGGEEFLLIAVEADLEHAGILAEKIRSTVENAEFIPVGHITISIGVAQYTYGETIAHFINRADDALYEAKRGGRNRVITANA